MFVILQDHCEYSPDFLEGLLDEDGPGGKKRKSWKHHKVDEGEGMYACDQCEKMFSKQSSLARHKYEHSGKFIVGTTHFYVYRNTYAFPKHSV
jgi:uncharacterized C2H2 Zn-finger protein